MADQEIIEKIQAELSPDSKCSLIRETMAKAVWLKKQSCNDLELVRLTIKKFNRHLKSGCFCVPRTGVHVAIATTYLEQYFLMLKNCMNNMNDIERRMKEYQEKMNVKKNLINDIASNDESGFTCYFNENVNTENFNQLLNILCLALHSYQKAFDLDKMEKKLTRIFLNKMGRGILENLITLYEIFVFYGMYQFALKTAKLSLIVVKQYYDSRSDLEEIIIIRCNFVKILLKLGFVDSAKNYFRAYFLNYTFTEENISEITSNSHSQIFLLNCELKLRIAKNSKVIGPLLKAFITGDYMKKSTVKRYIIKTMCFLLASRISCSFYKYDNYFIEFVEPIQLLVGMCRRWKMFQMFFSSNENIEINDPWSIRFQTLNMFNESLEFFLDFHVNNGLTTDHIFYYKIGVNLFSITLNLLSLSKLQLIAAKYDIMDGYYLDAKFKLTLFKSYFKKCSYNANLFDKPTDSSCQTSEPKKDEEIILNSLNNIKIDDCAQNNETSNNFDKYYQCYKQLIIESRTDRPEDNFCDNISLEKYLQKFITDFKQVKLPKDMIIIVFYQYLFYIINNLCISYEETLNTNAITTERYLFILKIFEHITLKIYAESIKKEKISQLSTTIDEQIIHGPFSVLFWLLSENFIRILIAKRSYQEALPFLHKLTKISSHSYSNRVYRSKLYYYQSFVAYKILKQMNVFEKPKMFQIKTFQFNEMPLIQDDGERTPTPKTVRNRRINVKAPVKVPCISDTAKQYGKSLLNVISQETLEGTRRNVLNFTDDLIINDDGNEQIKPFEPSTSSLSSSGLNSNYDVHAYENLGIFSDEKLLQFLKECTAISTNESLYITNSAYINFEKNESIDNILKDFTLDNVRTILMRIINYIGLHPTRELYIKMQYFLYKLARFTPHASRYASFHLSETASSHTFRYRLLFTSHKKMEQNKVNFDIEEINFKYDDFINCNYNINVLPSTWRFVQIKLLDNGTKFPSILLSRFDSKHSNTFMIKIKSDPEKVTKFFLDEFNEIIRINNVSILETEKEAFWKLRYEYDQRLKKLLISVEDNIFGIVKGIFMGKITDKKYIYRCREFYKCVKNLSQTMNLTCLNDQLLNIIIESIVILPNDYANIIAKVLFNTDNHLFVEEFLQLKKKYFRRWSNENELKELFKNIEPVGIILDPALSQFPFESLPTFRKLNQSYFRVPSLRVANLLYKKHQDLMKTGLDDKKTFYLLNPGNNLDNTEKYFKESFLSIMDWNGFVGTAPDGETLKENLETKDIYIYMGHGSGSQYYRTIPNGLDNVNVNSLSVVVGCSSGRITSQTKSAGIFGAPYRFLLNGAPAYIGMLWDVTDKDIDIFFNNFMSYCFKRWKSISKSDKISSICQAISHSRDSCKLKYLIGCSPVVYGLPIKNIL